MNNDKTYLVVTPFFPSNLDFVGSYVLDQLIELRNQTKFKIEIVKVVSIFSSEKDYLYNDFKISIFKVLDFPFFLFPGVFNFLNKRRFKLFLRNKRINNIVVSHAHVTYPSLYLLEHIQSKKIIQHHGLDVLQLLNGRINFFSKIYKSLLIRNSIFHLNNADLNIGVSQKVLDHLSSYMKYNPKDELVLYNGVNKLKFFKTDPIIRNESFTIGCIANFWKIKDQITLIKSVHLLLKDDINCKLRLIGSGYTLMLCKKYVDSNSLHENIIFEKELPHTELNKFYNEIDLFVLPSFYEALGCVYLESWATETPFIAIENQGISELLSNRNKTILLTEKENIFLLKDKIKFFIDNKVNLVFDSKLYIENTIQKLIKKIDKLAL